MELLSRKCDFWYEAFVTQSWWMFVVLFVALGLYCEGMRRKAAVEEKMLQESSTLSQSITKAQGAKAQLELEIASLSDPEWVEQILKRKLGVVPEKQTKVYFK